MRFDQYLFLIPLLPLANFVLLGLFGRKHFAKSAGIVSTALLAVCFLLSAYAAYSYFSKGFIGIYPQFVLLKYDWLRFSENMAIHMGMMLDSVSAMMIVVVSFVSLMVHIFSLWYMKGEERFAAYYAFLSLFTFSMLGLVLSSNLFQIYIFWELVGASSFLLIGFYYKKESAVAAAKKAFIVTRFADLGFLIGILVLGFGAGSFDFNALTITLPGSGELQTMLGSTFLGASALTWGLVLVFAGGAGKSAMFPLHIWLPDAMEGPTPVSALIHAATMVVAGVFLVARLFPIFSLDEVSLNLITWVGTASALFAAAVACTQTDIKRVLAYSTMSQIGYMMLALGVARFGDTAGLGYTASLFHLFTHAFFKSLLFLCAGAVIHFVHSNEMKNMGGLRKRLPLVHGCFLVACLAIAGIPPFAGFFSKEEILLAAYQSNKVIYAVALSTAALTAFYMFRLYFSVFWNSTRATVQMDGKPHLESIVGTLAMKVPLVLLTICSVVAGFVPFHYFITSDGMPMQVHLHIWFSAIPVGLSLLAILAAGVLYKKENEKPAKLAAALGSFYTAARRKFYVDEAYLFVTKRVLFNLIGRPAAWIDKNIVDGAMNGLASVTAATSNLIKGVQSGKVQSYALYFFAGVAVLTVVIVYVLK